MFLVFHHYLIDVQIYTILIFPMCLCLTGLMYFKILQWVKTNSQNQLFHSLFLPMISLKQESCNLIIVPVKISVFNTALIWKWFKKGNGVKHFYVNINLIFGKIWEVLGTQMLRIHSSKFITNLRWLIKLCIE